MKKTPKKLVLSKETVKNLETGKLQQVQGGAMAEDPTRWITCP